MADGKATVVAILRDVWELTLQLCGELLAEFRGFFNGSFSPGAAHWPTGERKRPHLDPASCNLGISRDRALAAAAHAGEKRALGGDTLPGVEVVELLANGRSEERRVGKECRSRW